MLLETAAYDTLSSKEAHYPPLSLRVLPYGVLPIWRQRYLLRWRMINPTVLCVLSLTKDLQKLRDPSLLKTDVCFVNGEWVKAKSGKTFEVRGRFYLETRCGLQAFPLTA